MKPASFEYFAPQTSEEALELLARGNGDAKVLAGGQSLIPAMNFRLARPAALIDLGRVAGLADISESEDGGLTIGAMSRQAQVERSAIVRERCPLLAEALPHVAHPQIRNRGTLGGSLAHADPSAELPAVVLALGARLRVRGPNGSRWVAADEFFRGIFTTALEPDELLLEIAVPPAPAGTGTAFEEVARRRGDYALAGAAAVVGLDGVGRCDRVRLALFGVADRPVLATRAAAVLIGESPTGAAMAAAATLACDELDPPGDMHASPDYRRHLAGVVSRRALARAAGRAAVQR